ncbi:MULTISPECIES: DUF4345 domain-containing protein [Sphingobacterium]|nr:MULTISPECIES: DUF4345 domain-containing protein [Sphingobacterium]MBA8984992.1 hypothetical protein [Sphingobacterium soli]OYD40689.1 DUF4345 domain-containing protein [Sphingobacterium cellulitidis]WFB63477.1 DUF4345 domain-containing protein [Sphingobacterium sp. WM]
MKTIKFLGYLIVCLSLLSLMYVSCLAWIDPSAVMQLVGVELNNNDALSSIRGVYGGVGFTLIAVIIFFTLKNLRHSLLLLAGFWIMYALSRLITIGIDGRLGDFGTKWLTIELLFFGISLALYLLLSKNLKIIKA